MAYSFDGKTDVDVNDGTGSLSYSASSCVSEDSSIAEDSQFLASLLLREQELHVEEQKLARRSRSLKKSPSPHRTPHRTGSGSTRATVSASESLDDDAAYQKFCRIRNNSNISGQTSDSNSHDGGALSGNNTSMRRHSQNNKKLVSAPAIVTPDASLRSGKKNSSRQSHNKRILSDPKNEVWYERLLCGMNSNC